ncbi:hypothetical protein BC835DRAFT_1421550 [Cytidiella melzeri]|nr:hypothetical protein BC835DRAFT_1421550 [Cytidiella melzeri]
MNLSPLTSNSIAWRHFEPYGPIAVFEPQINKAIGAALWIMFIRLGSNEEAVRCVGKEHGKQGVSGIGNEMVIIDGEELNVVLDGERKLLAAMMKELDGRRRREREENKRKWKEDERKQSLAIISSTRSVIVINTSQQPKWDNPASFTANSLAVAYVKWPPLSLVHARMRVTQTCMSSRLQPLLDGFSSPLRVNWGDHLLLTDSSNETTQHRPTFDSGHIRALADGPQTLSTRMTLIQLRTSDDGDKAKHQRQQELHIHTFILRNHTRLSQVEDVVPSAIAPSHLSTRLSISGLKVQVHALQAPARRRSSLSFFVTGIVFIAEKAAFTALHPKYLAIYSPRTFAPSASLSLPKTIY